jgi:Domain of unknown function (DUF1905)/Bacteriocin-protection, YdeI or OmpD-Associated
MQKVLVAHPVISSPGGEAMKKYKFTAKIEAGDGGGAYVLFPYDVKAEFGTAGKVPVNAKLDGVPYTGSLVKYGNPLHMLGVLKSIRQQIGKTAGDTIEVELWQDRTSRTIQAPIQLQKAIETAGLTRYFDGLSYTHKKEYCRWITEAKKEETQRKRIEKAVAMLKSGIKTPDASPQLQRLSSSTAIFRARRKR